MKGLVGLFACLILGLSYGQYENRTVVLDMTQRNLETNASRVLSAMQVMDVVGVPYDTTSSLTLAMQYPTIVLGARIKENAFNGSEITSIENWVSNGGTLISSNLRDPLFNNLMGVSNITSSNALFELTFDTAVHPEYFGMIDDSMEVTISLGRTSSGTTFYSRYYDLSTATSLADFENGFCGLAYNQFGNGNVYTFGPDFRDLIYRPRVNQDVNAHRVYSNGFEPSSDVIAIVLRNILIENRQNLVYKYTVPGNYSSVVMISHDIDSRTALDTMSLFADYEQSKGIVGQYNVTTRYTHDAWMSDWYLGGVPQLEYVRDRGHAISSHSVGHFPDFADDAVFPFGEIGQDTSSYKPLYWSGQSIGGNVLGEVEVSKFLLDSDLGVNVRSWRSGHLAYPDSLIVALDSMGYEFNSTFSANDVMTNLPYYAINTKSFSGKPSNVLEIPMTISDVFSSDGITESNYMAKVGIWSDVIKRYDRNNASSVILIHPNRGWKLDAQKAFVDSIILPQGLYPFEEYGEFWRKRDSLNFNTSLSNDTLYVDFESELGSQQSFVIDVSGLDSVLFFDQAGSEVTFLSQPFSNSQRLYYQSDLLTNGIEQVMVNDFVLYPNPTSSAFVVKSKSNKIIRKISVYGLQGELVLDKSFRTENEVLINLNELNISSGIYFVRIHGEDRSVVKKISYVSDN